MTFHSTCECRLESRPEESSIYDIISGNSHVGSVGFCESLHEWVLFFDNHVRVTHGFTEKVWSNLMETLQNNR